jgi:hypothetical protein
MALGEDPLVSTIMAAKNWDELKAALASLDKWDYVRAARLAPATTPRARPRLRQSARARTHTPPPGEAVARRC